MSIAFIYRARLKIDYIYDLKKPILCIGKYEKAF